MKSNFLPNRILISSQNYGKKWHYEILEHVQNMLSFHWAMKLDRVVLSGRGGGSPLLTINCPFHLPLWFPFPLNHSPPPTNYWLWRNDSFKFHLTVSFHIIIVSFPSYIQDGKEILEFLEAGVDWKFFRGREGIFLGGGSQIFLDQAGRNSK